MYQIILEALLFRYQLMLERYKLLITCNISDFFSHRHTVNGVNTPPPFEGFTYWKRLFILYLKKILYTNTQSWFITYKVKAWNTNLTTSWNNLNLSSALITILSFYMVSDFLFVFILASLSLFLNLVESANLMVYPSFWLSTLMLIDRRWMSHDHLRREFLNIFHFLPHVKNTFFISRIFVVRST